MQVKIALRRMSYSLSEWPPAIYVRIEQAGVLFYQP
jgi:hypothetical protein